MARSGSIDFSVSRDDLIKYALIDLGEIRISGTPNADQYTHGAWKLNVMAKRDMTYGLHLWALGEGTLFLVDDQESYSLGTGGDKAAITYVKTELSADAENTDTGIEVDSITGISNGDVIGVEQDDGVIHWTTINGAPSGSAITLTTGLTDDAATDNHVYTYTTILEKPVRILRDTVRIENASGTEIPIRLVSRAEYMSLSNKATTGVCNQVYYEPTYGATGTIYTWPTCEDVQNIIHFTFERALQDFDSSTDNPDFPIEASDYLIKGLRYELSHAYGTPQQDRMVLKAEYEEARDDWLEFNNEESSLFIQPDWR